MSLDFFSFVLLVGAVAWMGFFFYRHRPHLAISLDRFTGGLIKVIIRNRTHKDTVIDRLYMRLFDAKGVAFPGGITVAVSRNGQMIQPLGGALFGKLENYTMKADADPLNIGMPLQVEEMINNGAVQVEACVVLKGGKEITSERLSIGQLKQREDSTSPF